MNLNQKDTNIVYSSCLKLRFEDKDEINLQKASPMNEEEMIEFYETAIPYHFTIENICEIPTNVSINIESMPVKEDQKQLSDEWIDVNLYDGNTKASGETQMYNSSNRLIWNLVNENRLIETAKESYNLYHFTLKGKEIKEFNMLLYLDERTPATDDTMNASWIGKITLNAMQSLEEKGMLRKINKISFVNAYCIEEGGSVEECTEEYPNDEEGIWGYREQITEITFENTLDPKAHTEEGVLKFDESALKDHSVMVYLVPTGETVQVYDFGYTEKQAYKAYIQGNEEISANPDSSYLFDVFSNAESITGIEYLNTSNVTDMSYMFSDMESLTALDLGDQFNTSQVTNMSSMFSSMYNLAELNLGDQFDTSQVTDMSEMFDHAALETLNLGDKFDTSKVTNMNHMFSGMYNLTELKLGDQFNTSQVTDMSWMFSEMSVTNLNLGNQFNTNNVTNMSGMFGFIDLNELDLGTKFDTSKVTDMSEMFEGMSTLERLDLSNCNFNTEQVTDMNSMFSGMYSLTSLNLGDQFNTSKVTDMSWMFSEMIALTELNLGSQFDTSQVTDMGYMFSSMSNLTHIEYGNSFIHNPNVDISKMFDETNPSVNKPEGTGWDEIQWEDYS